MRRIDAQRIDQGEDEGVRVERGGAAAQTFVGEQLGVVPAGLAVAPPDGRQRPARQLLAGVPLALAEMQKSAGAVAGDEFADEFAGVAALGRPLRVGVPFVRVAVGGGDEGGLAALGEADVAVFELLIDHFAQGQHGLPLFVGVGLGDARRFVNAGHGHVMAELHLAFVDHAFNRGRARGLRRAGQGDVAFACEQAGGGVEADPPGPGQIHLAPGVQIGEVGLGSGGAVERLHVRGELNEVAGNEACRQTEVAQHLHQ